MQAEALPLPWLKRAALPKPALPCSRLAFVAPAHDRGDLASDGNAKLVLLKHSDFVAEASCLFKFEIARRFAHPLFKVFDVGAQIVADHVLRAVFDFDGHLVTAGDITDDVGDVAFD